jgi:hypothetical protein
MARRREEGRRTVTAPGPGMTQIGIAYVIEIVMSFTTFSEV